MFVIRVINLILISCNNANVQEPIKHKDNQLITVK